MLIPAGKLSCSILFSEMLLPLRRTPRADLQETSKIRGKKKTAVKWTSSDYKPGSLRVFFLLVFLRKLCFLFPTSKGRSKVMKQQSGKGQRNVDEALKSVFILELKLQRESGVSLFFQPTELFSLLGRAHQTDPPSSWPWRSRSAGSQDLDRHTHTLVFLWLYSVRTRLVMGEGSNMEPDVFAKINVFIWKDEVKYRERKSGRWHSNQRHIYSQNMTCKISWE